MKILVGCEESQAVCIEFRKRGHEAYSCDLQECSGGHPEYHLQMDILKAFEIVKPDMSIFFPPCTDLTKAGAPMWKQKQADGRQDKAINFVLELYSLPCSKIAIENPVGILNTKWRKPDQIFHPFYFGDPYKKMTCLWLSGLPKLKYQNIVEPIAHWHSGSIGNIKNGVRISAKLPPTKFSSSKIKSKTFPGIAKAMAEQWG